MVALQSVVETADAARAPISGRLRLGVIPTIGPFLLPRLMPALRNAFPHLQPYLRKDQTERLLAQLAEGKLDLLLLALACDFAGNDTLAVMRDDFLVALPAGHPLAPQSRISARSLSGERLLLLEDGHCLRDQALAAYGQTGRSGLEDFPAAGLHTWAQMAASGLGITLLPRLAVQAGVTAGTGIVLLPLVARASWYTLVSPNGQTPPVLPISAASHAYWPKPPPIPWSLPLNNDQITCRGGQNFHARRGHHHIINNTHANIFLCDKNIRLHRNNHILRQNICAAAKQIDPFTPRRWKSRRHTISRSVHAVFV